MTHLVIHYTYEDRTKFEAATALFYGLFPQGFEVEDPQVIADHIAQDLWDSHEFEPHVLDQSRMGLKVYIEAKDLEETQARVTESLEDADLLPQDVQVTPLPDKDWEIAWQEGFEVLHIGDRLQVVPDWLDPDEEGGDIILTMTPGLAFGTGTHETTRMCLAYLDDLVEEGMTVLDIGCGSGILAVAARLLGADRVDAVDTDPLALRAAASLGARHDAAIMVYASDLLANVLARGDLVLANIVPEAVMAIFPDLDSRLAPGGRMIASGIRTDREEDVVRAGEAHGFYLWDRKEEGGWVALVFGRKDDRHEDV